MKMSTLIDISILIGIFLTFFAGISFFIPNEKKLKAKLFFENLTLQADYYDETGFYSKYKTAEVQTFFTSLIFFIALFVIILTVIISGFFWGEGGFLEQTIGKDGSELELLRALFCGITLSIIWKYPIPQIINWCLRKNNLGKITLRYIFVISLLYVGLLIILLASNYLINGEIITIGIPKDNIYTYVELIVGWPIYMILFTVGFNLAFLWMLKRKSQFLKLTIRFWRYFLWRIVEYEKGVIGAMTLLITIVLGIIKILY